MRQQSPLKKPTRIVLLDDQVMFRQCLREEICKWEGFEVVGETGECQQAIHLIYQLTPDIVILEYSMQGLGGLELAPRILSISSGTRTVILTENNNATAVHQALRAGCRGYVLKSDSVSELEYGIQSVMDGRIFISPSISSKFIAHLLNQADRCESSTSILTDREKVICHLLARGYSTAELAENLCVSQKTIRVHIANIMKKLNCASRTELVVFIMSNNVDLL